MNRASAPSCRLYEMVNSRLRPSIDMMLTSDASTLNDLHVPDTLFEDRHGQHHGTIRSSTNRDNGVVDFEGDADAAKVH